MNESLSEATAEAVEEFDSYIANLPLDEAITALRGIREYAEALQSERDIEMGWHHMVD